MKLFSYSITFYLHMLYQLRSIKITGYDIPEFLPHQKQQNNKYDRRIKQFIDYDLLKNSPDHEEFFNTIY